MDVDRPYSCKFSDAWRHQPSYRLFWKDGWAQPIAYVSWLPSSARVHLDFVQNMCQRSQPILFQCGCSDCKVHEDLEDIVTGERTGLCSDKSLPTPCSKCKNCMCSYPEDTSLGFLTQQIISQIAGGIHVGCTDRESNTRCTAILDDLPMKLEVDCQAGTCIEDELAAAIVEAEGEEEAAGQEARHQDIRSSGEAPALQPAVAQISSEQPRAVLRTVTRTPMHLLGIRKSKRQKRRRQGIPEISLRIS